MKVLVAEDNTMVREAMVTLIESHGHLVVPAIDGKQAAECLNFLNFDLVVTDNDMPYLTGLELAELCREKGTLFVMQSAKNISAQADEASAYQFIYKKDLFKKLPPLLRDVQDFVDHRYN